MATQYVSTEGAETWLLEYRTTLPASWAALGSTAKSLALINATDWLDLTYGNKWKGTRTASTQERDWPRSGVVDNDDYDVASDEIPEALERACAEAAVLYVDGDLDSLPMRVDSDARLRSKAISAGSVSKSVTYAGAGLSESAEANISFPKITKILRHLIVSGDTTTLEVCL
jgi:hypothetical protein